MTSPSDTFRQSIAYAVLTGRDAHGKPALGPVGTARARVPPSRRLIRDANGNEHLAAHVVYTDAPLTLQHRLWLPGEDVADFSRARCRDAAPNQPPLSTNILRASNGAR